MVCPRFLLGVIMMAGASACSGEGERDIISEEPLAAEPAAQEDKFGKGFGKAFRADPNSEPANVSDNDVNPVSHTAEPLDVD